MSRPRGSKNKKKAVPDITDVGPMPEPPPENKPIEVTIKPDLTNVSAVKSVSIYEAAQKLKTTENTIKLWVSHGHLEEFNGRIPVNSIEMCRFNSSRRFR